tara:strand:+ start:351 stop:524 length:174 start_codon:yes stop_codon:yes gene_type:complete
LRWIWYLKEASCYAPGIVPSVSILFEVDMVFEAGCGPIGHDLPEKFQSYLRWIWYLK